MYNEVTPFYIYVSLWVYMCVCVCVCVCVYVYEFPWWLSGKEPAYNARDTGDVGSIPGSGRSPGGGHGNPLQYSCLEDPMCRGAWRATVHGVAKSQTWLKWLSTHTRVCVCVCVYPFKILFSMMVCLSQDIDHSCLCCTAGPCPSMECMLPLCRQTLDMLWVCFPDQCKHSVSQQSESCHLWLPGVYKSYIHTAL